MRTGGFQKEEGQEFDAFSVGAENEGGPGEVLKYVFENSGSNHAMTGHEIERKACEACGPFWLSSLIFFIWERKAIMHSLESGFLILGKDEKVHTLGCKQLVRVERQRSGSSTGRMRGNILAWIHSLLLNKNHSDS